MKAGTVLRAILAASATAALSLTTAGAATAAPTAHPRSGHPVTGGVLATALLPGSVFGRDYDLAALTTATDPPGQAALWTVGGMSCAMFEGSYLDGYGDTAEASMTVQFALPAVPAGSTPASVHQDVAQFPTRHAAQLFFSQAQAKFRHCVSFLYWPYQFPRVVLTGRGVTATTVRGYPAFRVDQELRPAVVWEGDPVAYQTTIVGLAGTTVYLIQQQEDKDAQIPAWMPTDLASRLQALDR